MVRTRIGNSNTAGILFKILIQILSNLKKTEEELPNVRNIVNNIMEIY